MLAAESPFTLFPSPFVVFPFQFQNHHVAGSFLEPVHEQLCPNYHHYIKYPIGEQASGRVPSWRRVMCSFVSLFPMHHRSQYNV